MAYKRMDVLGRNIEKNEDLVLCAWLEIFFTNQCTCRKIESRKIKMFLIAYTSLNHLGENFNFFNDDVTITCSLWQFYCTQVSTKTLY